MNKKTILKLSLSFIALILLAVIGISAYVLTNARQILTAELEKNLGVKVRVSDLKIVLPSSVVIRDFSIGDNIRFQKLVISPNLLGFIKGDIIINSIVLEKPQLKITRNADNSIDFGIALKKKEREASVAPQGTPAQQAKEQKETKGIRNFYLHKLTVHDAVIEFVDRAVSQDIPFTANLSHVNLDVTAPSWLVLSHLQFKASGDIMTQNQKAGKIATSGWIDILAKDMDAKVDISDLKLAYFRPYYKKYYEKELKSGDLLLAADLKSKSNDLTAQVHIEAKNLAFKEKEATQEPSSEGQAPAMDVTALIFGTMFSGQGSTVFDFTVRTRMDDPKFENVRLKGAFLQPMVKNILSQPPQETIEDFKKVGEQFEAIGKEFKKIFKGD